MAPPVKKKDAARPSSAQQTTLERFQGIIRRVVSKDDERSSLVDDIACVVGAEILEGLRRPGSDLNSVELSRRFRTSRTPTREAVVILEKEGLVEILPRRRPRVADLSISEIREIYRVRAAMLGLIAAEVARLATDADIAELRAILSEMEHADAAGDRDGYYWANVNFHERFAVIVQRKARDVDRLRAAGGLLIDDNRDRAAFDPFAERQTAPAGETRVYEPLQHLVRLYYMEGVPGAWRGAGVWGGPHLITAAL